MKITDTKDLKGLLRFASHPDRQAEGDRITLTVLDILQIMGEGVIGPGGTGIQEARQVKRPLRKSSGDPSGYWDLAQGPYWVTYNESVSIPEGRSLVIQPHPVLLKNGLWHPTLVVRDWAELPGILLVVAARGVRMLEGSPISTGFIIEP